MILAFSFLCLNLILFDNIPWLYFSSNLQNGDERLTSQRNYKICMLQGHIMCSVAKPQCTEQLSNVFYRLLGLYKNGMRGEFCI